MIARKTACMSEEPDQRAAPVRKSSHRCKMQRVMSLENLENNETFQLARFVLPFSQKKERMMLGGSDAQNEGYKSV